MPPRFPSTARVTFTKAGGAAAGAAISMDLQESTFNHAAKETVAPTQMVNTVAPAVTGTATVGQTLTTTQGTWTGANAVYDYRWQRSIDGGTRYEDIVSGNGATTYVLIAADQTHRIRCRVRSTNGAGARFAVSNVVGPIA